MKAAAVLMAPLGAIVVAAGALAQAPPPAPPRPMPVAANTLASTPDAFYGQVVSVTAAVDRTLSASAFVVDQDGAKSSEQELLVIAPTLISSPDPGIYVTIVGDVLRFDAADIARRAKDYKLDLGPEVIARYEGHPAILATSVVTAAMVDLAKRPPPPLSPEEEAFDKVMKRVGPAFNDLRAALTASDAGAAAEHTKVLKAAFADAEPFWKARNAADAVEWTRSARTHLTALERAAGAGNWDQVTASVAEVNRMCSTCHTAYRERLEDGTFRVKSAAPPR
ncbi:MAG: hypothetical protein WD690_03610 [Vicinamibacterales bacterium]